MALSVVNRSTEIVNPDYNSEGKPTLFALSNETLQMILRVIGNQSGTREVCTHLCDNSTALQKSTLNKDLKTLIKDLVNTLDKDLHKDQIAKLKGIDDLLVVDPNANLQEAKDFTMGKRDEVLQTLKGVEINWSHEFSAKLPGSFPEFFRELEVLHDVDTSMTSNMHHTSLPNPIETYIASAPNPIRAIEVVKMLSNVMCRDLALIELLKRFIDPQNMSICTRIIEEMSSNRQHQGQLILATNLYNMGEYEKFREIMQRTSSLDNKVAIYSALAESAVGTDRFDKVIEEVKRIPFQSVSFDVLSAISLHLLEMDELDLAINVALEIKSPGISAYPLTSICTRLSSDGDYEKATEVAHRIQHPEYKRMALDNIARRRNMVGQ